MSTPPRYRRVDQGRIQADLSVQKLWLHYISLSGIADLLDVDAYLHGLIDLDTYQEDKLSYAVNEQLDELHQASRLPYAYPWEAAPPAENPLDVLHQLLDAARSAATDDDRTEPLPPRSPDC